MSWHDAMDGLLMTYFIFFCTKARKMLDISSSLTIFAHSYINTEFAQNSFALHQEESCSGLSFSHCLTAPFAFVEEWAC